MIVDLLACVHFVKQQRAALPHIDNSAGDRYRETADARRIATEKMVKAIGEALPKVKINERWDGASVSIAGIRASSTQGIDQALANWVAAAYRRLDQAS